MWIKQIYGGRVNLDQATSLLVSGSGSVWVVHAHLTDGTTHTVSADFTTAAAAEAEVDRLLLNGS